MSGKSLSTCDSRRVVSSAKGLWLADGGFS